MLLYIYGIKDWNPPNSCYLGNFHTKRAIKTLHAITYKIHLNPIIPGYHSFI
ncbi:hypothetical protein Syun_012428 [Stephania yunnanensis]|uniref:Uncharacterized protein n=1 Tax=Stephania yunnanensis TaxID=152371 RepID=A0AAP0K0T1_9MAGN